MRQPSRDLNYGEVPTCSPAPSTRLKTIENLKVFNVFLLPGAIKHNYRSQVGTSAKSGPRIALRTATRLAGQAGCWLAGVAHRPGCRLPAASRHGLLALGQLGGWLPGGAEVQPGSVDPWHPGPMYPGIPGSTESWSPGSMHLWTDGSVDPWIHGPMNPKTPGSWIHGCRTTNPFVDPWRQGSGIHPSTGSMDTWINGRQPIPTPPMPPPTLTLSTPTPTPITSITPGPSQPTTPQPHPGFHSHPANPQERTRLLCIALLCVALHCGALHRIAFSCLASCCFALCCFALRRFASLCVALLCIALHCFVLHCIALFCFVVLTTKSAQSIFVHN